MLITHLCIPKQRLVQPFLTVQWLFLNYTYLNFTPNRLNSMPQWRALQYHLPCCHEPSFYGVPTPYV